MNAPPRASARFYKAHGLGNDYLVFRQGTAWPLTAGNVARVCHRWRGVGADGVVLWLDPGDDGAVVLRMFNPDGTEFERSGNGLRVLASFLYREGHVDSESFEVEVGGGRVRMTVHGRREGRYDVSVEMGRASVGPSAVALEPGALTEGRWLAGPEGEPLDVVAVAVGNPHLVVWGEDLDEARLREIGPHLCAHPALDRGANVQLAERAPDGTVRALIWERGVGPTTASGTSACAVAVAAVHRGERPPGRVGVIMPGGMLDVVVSAELETVLRGPVEEVLTGTLEAGFVAELDGA